MTTVKPNTTYAFPNGETFTTRCYRDALFKDLVYSEDRLQALLDAGAITEITSTTVSVTIDVPTSWLDSRQGDTDFYSSGDSMYSETAAILNDILRTAPLQ